MTECLSRFTLVRFHQKDLSSGSMKEVQEHIGNCAKCQQVLHKISANESTYNAKLDFHTDRLLDAIAAEGASPNQEEPNVVSLAAKQKKQGVIHILIPLAAVASIVVALYFFPQFKTPQGETIGYKGRFSAAVFAKRNSALFPVEDQTVLYPNDALRFRIQTSAEGYVYVFNVDEKGTVLGLYPFDPAPDSKGLKITTPGEHMLDDSVVLDESTGTEHFVVVFATTPLNIGNINGQAKAIIQHKALPTEQGNAQVKVFTIEKK